MNKIFYTFLLYFYYQQSSIILFSSPSYPLFLIMPNILSDMLMSPSFSATMEGGECVCMCMYDPFSIPDPHFGSLTFKMGGKFFGNFDYF